MQLRISKQGPISLKTSLFLQQFMHCIYNNMDLHKTDTTYINHYSDYTAWSQAQCHLVLKNVWFIHVILSVLRAVEIPKVNKKPGFKTQNKQLVSMTVTTRPPL